MAEMSALSMSSSVQRAGKWLSVLSNLCWGIDREVWQDFFLMIFWALGIRNSRQGGLDGLARSIGGHIQEYWH